MEILTSMESINVFIKESSFTIIYFSSSSCNVCVNLIPKIEKLLRGYSKVAYAKVEIENLPLVSGAFSIFTLPCILGFIDGKEIIREARFVNIKELEGKIQRYYDFI